jgi:endonuclease/exonuclease/phosphatase (EEP) superfamily protein YafD
MDRILTLALFFVSLSFNAEAGIRPLGHFYKLVPESKAHTTFGHTADNDLDRHSIKVLVWNIKKTSMAPWQSEFANYGQGKDLFLLQEAYESQAFKSTLSSFENVRWVMGISFIYSIFNNAATGNIFGSTVEPTYVQVLHTPDLEPVVATPKATTIGKYAIEGSNQELLAISVHGINLTSFGAFKRHMDQIKALIEAHDGPVLFAGDFNTRTGARTRYLQDLAKALGMETVKFKNDECRMKFKLTPYYLDHSFVKGLTVKNSEVDCDSRGSDHRPMLLELAVAE